MIQTTKLNDRRKKRDLEGEWINPQMDTRGMEF